MIENNSEKRDMVTEAAYWLVAQPLKQQLTSLLEYGMSETQVKDIVAWAINGALVDYSDKVAQANSGH